MNETDVDGGVNSPRGLIMGDQSPSSSSSSLVDKIDEPLMTANNVRSDKLAQSPSPQFLHTIQSYDWAATPVGPQEKWPSALRTAYDICMYSSFPQTLFWGEDNLYFYNEAYLPILGTHKKHPGSLGHPLREVWYETWPMLEPILKTVRETRLGVLHYNLLFHVHRLGFLEECYCTVSFSPFLGDDGTVSGIWSTIVEVTDILLGQRRIALLSEFGGDVSCATNPSEALQKSAQLLKNSPDLPFALFYLRSTDSEVADCFKYNLDASTFDALPYYFKDVPRSISVVDKTKAELKSATSDEPSQESSSEDNVSSEGTRNHRKIEGYEKFKSTSSSSSSTNNEETIEVEKSPNHNKKITAALIQTFHRVCETGRAEMVVLPKECDIAEKAVVFPLLQQETVIGLLVLALNKLLPINDSYRDWLLLVSSHVASAMISAKNREEERTHTQKLAELDKSKTIFFNNVSHEFRTPLTLMMSPVEDALLDVSLPKPHLETLNMVYRNGQRLMRLVNTLLEFGRIEAGRQVAQFVQTDLGNFTRELASAFHSAAVRLGLKYTVNCPSWDEDDGQGSSSAKQGSNSEDRDAYIDRDMWEKIVLNLISNALKFTWQGEVSVRLARRSKFAELIVSDTGVGVSAEDQQRIFERFYRTPNSKGRSQEGSGIGLALVKELVKTHGGTIEMESRRGKRGGTRFRVRIPLGTTHLAAGSIILRADSAEIESRDAQYQRLTALSDARSQYSNEAQYWNNTMQPVSDSKRDSSCTASTDGTDSEFSSGHAHKIRRKSVTFSGESSGRDTNSASGEVSGKNRRDTEASSTDASAREGRESINSPSTSSGIDGRRSGQAIIKGERRSRVLVADDNSDMRHYIKTLLDPFFKVLTVFNGKDALAEARRRPPDLVLSDVMMPEMDGIQLLQALRANPATMTTPVILLSALAGSESSVDGLEAGADDYLVKPFSARELIAKVKATTRMSQLRMKMVEKERQQSVHKQLVSAVTEKIRAGLFTPQLCEQTLRSVTQEVVRAMEANFVSVVQFTTPDSDNAQPTEDKDNATPVMGEHHESMDSPLLSGKIVSPHSSKIPAPMCRVIAVATKSKDGDVETIATTLGKPIPKRAAKRFARKASIEDIEEKGALSLLWQSFPLRGDPNHILRNARDATISARSTISDQQQKRGHGDSDSENTQQSPEHALPTSTQRNMRGDIAISAAGSSTDTDNEFELQVLQNALKKIVSVLPIELRGDPSKGERSMSAIIMVKNRVWGLISCVMSRSADKARRKMGSSRTKARWTEADESALNQIAGQLGLGITQAQLAGEQQERQQKLEEAYSANKAKSMIMANTSHELRTPLNAIIGMMEMLQDTTLNADQKEMVHTVSSSSELLLAIVNDILDYSRLEADKVTFHLSNFCVQDLVESTMDMFAEMAGGKGIELVTISHLPLSFPNKIRSDSGRMQQVLINLVNNAIKFTTTGEVVVSLSLVTDSAGRKASNNDKLLKGRLPASTGSEQEPSSLASSSVEKDEQSEGEEDEENTESSEDTAESGPDIASTSSDGVRTGSKRTRASKDKQKIKHVQDLQQQQLSDSFRSSGSGRRSRSRKKGVMFYRLPTEYANENVGILPAVEDRRGSLDEASGSESAIESTERFFLRFDVRDTGIGISQEGIDRLFRSFSQVDNSMTRTYGGTGLGLAISKQLVQLAGGRIGARSRPGRGSCFWFTWEVVPAIGFESPSPMVHSARKFAKSTADSTPVGPSPAPSPAGSADKVPTKLPNDLGKLAAPPEQRVLIIDHSDSSLTSICLHLRGIADVMGVRVLSEGMEVFRQAAGQQRPFSIVLIDTYLLSNSTPSLPSTPREPVLSKIHSPPIGGPEAGTSEALALSTFLEMQLLHPPVHMIFLTFSDVIHRDETNRLLATLAAHARSGNMCGYLTKPIKRAKLLKCIRGAIALSVYPNAAESPLSIAAGTEFGTPRSPRNSPRTNTLATQLVAPESTVVTRTLATDFAGKPVVPQLNLIKDEDFESPAASPRGPITAQETVSTAPPTSQAESTTTTSSVGTPLRRVTVSAAAKQATTGGKHARKVLVVEDNKVNQKVVLSQLAKLGFEADTAINGLEAVHRVQQQDYALVLMDVAMPVMDGFEATAKIRAMGNNERKDSEDTSEDTEREKYQQLPIIALTASVMDGDHARCMRAGMNDFLSKPLRATALAAAMKRWYPEGEASPSAT